MKDLLIEIFCDVDDFCIVFNRFMKRHIITPNNSKKVELNTCKSLELSEIIAIIIYFHHSSYRNFKHYYKKLVTKALRDYFPNLPSYNRFVELSQETLIPLILYTKKCRMGKCTGISFIDSTTLDVCDNRRIHSHKVFEGIAKRGKSSTGWFFGFKLHITINDRGEILSFCITPGDIDDRNTNVIEILTKKLTGKLVGDKGYISQKLFERLYSKGLKLITKLKKNMKNKLMEYSERILLRKRAVIESVNDFLKNICQIEHTRHRSFSNFLVNIISGIAAYSFLPKKPSLNIDKKALISA